MNSADYIQVTITLSPFSEEMAEILTAELSELPYDGFLVEEPCLKAYVPRESYRPGDLKVVLSGFDCVSGFQAELMPQQNWNKEWEDRFEPIVVDGGQVTVKASFNTDAPRSRFNIWIDPSMAFGTGYHQTTYMMMQMMLRGEEAIRGRNVLDMGCGTAVLSILAAKMRARKVWAVDIDSVAARSAWANVRWNRVSTRVEVLCGDASLLQMGLYDVILANIHRNIILEDLPTYVRCLRRGGLLVVSGFFAGDAAAVTEAAVRQGLSRDESLERDGWSCLRFLKDGGNC